MFYLTSWGLDTSYRYFDQEHFETNHKSLRLPVQQLWLSNSGFLVFGDLDRCSILSHALGMT